MAGHYSPLRAAISSVLCFAGSQTEPSIGPSELLFLSGLDEPKYNFC